MSHWNYRVVKHTYEDEVEYTVHEVYYDDEGKYKRRTVNAIPARGDTFESCKADLMLQLEAFGKPPIDGETGEDTR